MGRSHFRSRPNPGENRGLRSLRNGRPGSLSDLLDDGGLLHGGECALLHDGVLDVLLDGCQVRFAIHHKIGVILAGKHILTRCR